MIATIREYRCDMGCGAKHQTEEQWLPDGWLQVQFGVFGTKKTDHHLCPGCAPTLQKMMAGGGA